MSASRSYRGPCRGRHSSEHLRLTDVHRSGPRFSATVTLVEALGHEQLVHAVTIEARATVRLPAIGGGLAPPRWRLAQWCTRCRPSTYISSTRLRPSASMPRPRRRPTGRGRGVARARVCRVRDVDLLSARSHDRLGTQRSDPFGIRTEYVGLDQYREVLRSSDFTTA